MMMLDDERGELCDHGLSIMCSGCHFTVRTTVVAIMAPAKAPATMTGAWMLERKPSSMSSTYFRP